MQPEIRVYKNVWHACCTSVTDWSLLDFPLKFAKFCNKIFHVKLNNLIYIILYVVHTVDNYNTVGKPGFSNHDLTHSILIQLSTVKQLWQLNFAALLVYHLHNFNYILMAFMDASVYTFQRIVIIVEPYTGTWATRSAYFIKSYR